MSGLWEDADPATRESLTCPECRGLGWLLNELHATPEHAPRSHTHDTLQLDLIPCIYPDCNAPRPNGDPRPIDTLGIRGQFNTVIRSPRGTLLALTDYTAPAYR